MNLKHSINIVSKFLELFGLLILVPIICSLIYDEGDIYAFVLSALLTVLVGIVADYLTRSGSDDIDFYRKDGFFIASFCWITAVIFGSLPYLFSGTLHNPVDAIFESVSGFTTTGSSIISNIEAVPHGILFWRSFTQWLGGMGIIILAIAILPRLSVGGMQLMSLEAPGPTTEKLTPRIAETAKHLWGVYLFLTLLMLVILKLLGMPLYDSFIHVFSTLSTGGFSNKNLSVGAYDNAQIEYVITVFMFIAGANFALLYWALRGNLRKLVTNPEFKFYLLINLLVILAVTSDLYIKHFDRMTDAFRYASFNIVSISTTTGFASIDFDKWPEFSKYLLVLLMFIGGCSGSTSGSVKVMRIIILIKQAFKEIKKNIYPNAVFPLNYGGNIIDDKVTSSIISFFLIYIFIFAVSVIILTLDGISIISAFTACAANIGNVGPGLDFVGPSRNYSELSNLSKSVLSFLMLVGRLELFAVLVIFTPHFWKK